MGKQMEGRGYEVVGDRVTIDGNRSDGCDGGVRLDGEDPVVTNNVVTRSFDNVAIANGSESTEAPTG